MGRRKEPRVRGAEQQGRKKRHRAGEAKGGAAWGGLGGGGHRELGRGSKERGAGKRGEQEKGGSREKGKGGAEEPGRGSSWGWHSPTPYFSRLVGIQRAIPAALPPARSLCHRLPARAAPPCGTTARSRPSAGRRRAARSGAEGREQGRGRPGTARLRPLGLTCGRSCCWSSRGAAGCRLCSSSEPLRRKETEGLV